MCDVVWCGLFRLKGLAIGSISVQHWPLKKRRNQAQYQEMCDVVWFVSIEGLGYLFHFCATLAPQKTQKPGTIAEM
jgi:hypothetical protein